MRALRQAPARTTLGPAGLHTWKSRDDFTVVDVKTNLNRWAREHTLIRPRATEARTYTRNHRVLTAAISSVRRRLGGVHQDHKRIARSAIILLGFVLAGKVVNATKKMTIAYRYGISGTIDAYQLAFTLVNWVPVTLTSELRPLLVPALIRLRRNREAQSQFLGEVEGLALFVGTVLPCCFACYGRISRATHPATFPKRRAKPATG